MTMSTVGRAVQIAEGALEALFANVDPKFVLVEGMTIGELVASSNSFRDPSSVKGNVDDQAVPTWTVDPKNKEITVEFVVRGSGPDSKIHRPQVRFLNVRIEAADPKAAKKNARSKVANLIPLRVPKDPNFDLEQWMMDNEDKYETPEELEAAAAALTDVATTYYVEPITSKTEIAVRCTCEDFHWTFSRANTAKGAFFGKPTGSYDTTGGGKPRNPDNIPGYCYHIHHALTSLSSQTAFWQAKVKLASTSSRPSGRDIGVWAAAAGF